MSKLSELTRDELRDLCRKQKLQVQGSKAELLKRLKSGEVPSKAPVKKAKPAKKAAKPKSKTKYKALGHDLKVTPIKKILRERKANAKAVAKEKGEAYLKKVRKERKERAKS